MHAGGVVEYEPDTELRDTEQIPLQREQAASRGSCGVTSSHTRPTPGTSLKTVKVGYEISFNRYFYKPEPMRTLEEIRADILMVERETEGLLHEIMGHMK